MAEPTAEQTEAYLDFSMRGFDISKGLSELDERYSEGVGDTGKYHQELTALTQSALECLTESQKKFPDFFSANMEAEAIRRSLSEERRRDFTLRFNELLYESISDPLRPIDAIADYSPLQRAIELVYIGDRLNAKNHYERPNLVRQSGDAVIGRVVQNMLEFNMDPRLLRIPSR